MVSLCDHLISDSLLCSDDVPDDLDVPDFFPYKCRYQDQQDNNDSTDMDTGRICKGIYRGTAWKVVSE